MKAKILIVLAVGLLAILAAVVVVGFVTAIVGGFVGVMEALNPLGK